MITDGAGTVVRLGAGPVGADGRQLVVEQSAQWVQPPFSNAYWVPGYWQHNDGQFLWRDGHWAAADQGVVVQKPIDGARRCTKKCNQLRPATTGYVWQPGYWQWRGTWVWVPGEYIQTVTPGAVWVQGEWEAINGTWRWNPAHWARLNDRRARFRAKSQGAKSKKLHKKRWRTAVATALFCVLAPMLLRRMFGA